MNITTNKINILQHNAGRGAIVMDLILNYCIKEKVDILMLQDPYSRNGLLPGFEVAPYRTMITKGELRRGSKALIHGSAIIALNPNLKILFRDDLTTQLFTVATIHTNSTENITLISAYFKFSTRTETRIEMLQDIINAIDTLVIICADVNAHATDWFCDSTNQKGEVVVRFVEQNDLRVINERSPTYTFNGPRFSSNVDITLCSRSLVSRLENWEVRSEVTTSDHAVIGMSLSARNMPRYEFRPARYCERLADWDAFDVSLIFDLVNNQEELSFSCINNRARLLTEVVQRAAKKAIPVNRSRSRCNPPWWTSAVVNKRKELKKASRSKFVQGTRTLCRDYTKARNEYLKHGPLLQTERCVWEEMGPQ